MRKLLLTVVILLFGLIAIAESNPFNSYTYLKCDTTISLYPIDKPYDIYKYKKTYYFYLDNIEEKVFNGEKKPLTVYEYNNQEIKFNDTAWQDKRTYNTDFVIDRYTGQMTLSGTIRHDYGNWATITHDNQDRTGIGVCEPQVNAQRF